MFSFNITEVKKRRKDTLSPIVHFGPHNEEVISLLYGSLLGDCHGEKRGNTTRFQIKQSSINVEY
jgi:hypothetical protein